MTPSWQTRATGWCLNNVPLRQVRHLLYRELDRGDGVCRYLDGNLCSIYATRPLLCRVDESYEVYFKDKMSKEEYYRQNYLCCEQLKKQEEL